MSRLRRVALWVVVPVLVVNAVAAAHARSFLYFADEPTSTPSPEHLTLVDALGVLLTGPRVARPEHRTDPSRALGRAYSQHNVSTSDGIALSYWEITPDIPADTTVLVLHGYGGSADQLLSVADWMLGRGLRVALLDFRGAGDSTGDHTTLGWHEASDVAALTQDIRSRHGGPVVAYGFSMGAAAALGAAGRLQVPLDGIVAEAPYATMWGTVRARFSMMGLPSEPGASLLMVWGSVWGGFWSPSLAPVRHAEAITVPTVVLSGTLDRRAPVADGAAIAAALGGPARHVVLPETAHQVGLSTQPEAWGEAVGWLLDGL